MGVPWDVVMEMDEAWVIGFLVAGGEAKGEKFDWGAMKWRERKG